MFFAERKSHEIHMHTHADAHQARGCIRIWAPLAGVKNKTHTHTHTHARSHQVGGLESAGLDMKQGTIGDMAELGICESFRVKCQVCYAC
jgi:hypothetical protein